MTEQPATPGETSPVDDTDRHEGGADVATVAAYDLGAVHYADHRSVHDSTRARCFAETVPAGRCLDLGCGPGLWFSHLPRPLVGCDASGPMLELARRSDVRVPTVRASIEALPFARGAFHGIWANKCLQHVAASELAMVVADLHRTLVVDGRLALECFAGTGTFRFTDDLPGRRFTLWDPDELTDVVVGAGFAVDDCSTVPGGDLVHIRLTATRLRTLPDTVGEDMRLLVCGLNPSLVAADAGVGFAGATNRFWKALHGAGLSDVDRDARELLRRDRIGMTDQVKRATRAAGELTAADYRSGLSRLERLVARTEPRSVVIVGLAGWRAAVDRRAGTGWQPSTPLAAPTYVMPSTSGLNAHATLGDLIAHLRAAACPP